MKLLINGEPVEINPRADQTLLQTVRERGLTGTKEGCASGDCGACTVLVGELEQDSIAWRTVNACIAPTGQFAGANVVTVEGLATAGPASSQQSLDISQLHPAQAQMVECHGSQCGYCTPGFVMSLAALVETGAPPDRGTVLEGISGNLCRCTGYRPIVDAGLAALATPWQSRLADASSYAAVAQSTGNAVERPATEAQLQQALKRDAERPLIAGGTDFMLEVTQRFREVPAMIDLTSVAGLRQIEEQGDTIVIGAATPYSAIEHWAATHDTPLHELLIRLGSRQIRNNGTIGGNLANGSPIADMPPVLIVYNASIELVNADGVSRRVAVSDFYLGYRQTVLAADEYIARVHIPKSSLNQFHRFYKSSKRIEDDISSVMGAFCFEGDGNKISAARIAFGGMAATPVRLEALEALLTSVELDDDLVKTACQQIGELMTPMTDVRASAQYRQDMAASMLERALLAFRDNEVPVITQVVLDA